MTPILVLAFGAAVGLGVVGCGKTQADSSIPGVDARDSSAQNDQSKTTNLCEMYTSCDACVSGQTSRGSTEGEAETQCALAVIGCWVTWDKPVVCGDDTYDRQPSSASDSINLCEAYMSCDACISGQMSRGNTEGEAETQCALAVTGCWTTWDKPITCGDHRHDEQRE